MTSEQGNDNDNDNDNSTPQKESPVKRVTMSGMDGAETAPELDDKVDQNDDSQPMEEAPIMENNSKGGDRPVAPNEPVANGDSHATSRKLTKIERLMARMEKRKEHRMEVSYRARSRFVRMCFDKVEELGGTRANGIPVADLLKMNDECITEGPEVVAIFERAVKVCEDVDAKIFYFRDFNEYYLVRPCLHVVILHLRTNVTFASC